jgi:nucleoside-diphosphate-sugar epimerase
MRIAIAGGTGTLGSLVAAELARRGHEARVRRRRRQGHRGPPGRRWRAERGAGWSPWARRPPRRLRIATVNGAPGLVMRDADGVLTVIAFTIDAGRITALDVMRNPDKLGGAPEPG